MGKPIGSLNAAEYQEQKPRLRGVIAECLAQLKRRYDLVVIEGAGSPAEINLKSRDIVNMHVARVADAKVLLVGDIDRGGVFAAFVGTLALLDPDERDRIAAFVINKFRGDVALLRPGLDFLTARTKKPVLGVLPYVPSLRIADEDSVSLDDRARRRRPSSDLLDIVVVRFPRISNYDDVEALEHSPGVSVRFAERPDEVRGADLVILPGSKSTVSDLGWLRDTGIAGVIHARARNGEPILGVCGGCEMLGVAIEDPDGVESDCEHVPGLDLLPLRTRFGREKITAQVVARTANTGFLGAGSTEVELRAYEIHMGVVERTAPGAGPFVIISRNGAPAELTDGATSPTGSVVGTMLHGIFENDAFRAGVLDRLRERRGLAAPELASAVPTKEAEYDRLEAVVREHIDRDLLFRIARLARS
jgi:adenosylcobyric acid synthase